MGRKKVIKQQSIEIKQPSVQPSVQTVLKDFIIKRNGDCFVLKTGQALPKDVPTIYHANLRTEGVIK